MDFNRDQVQYIWSKQDSGVAVSGHIQTEAILWLTFLLWAIGEQSKDAADPEREFLGGLVGSLHHLNAFLLQAERFGDHIKAIEALPSRNFVPEYPIVIVKEAEGSNDLFAPPAMIRVLVDRIEYDFLQLLLSGVATLERMAMFVSGNVIGHETNFYNFRGALAASDSARAARLTAIMDAYLPEIAGVLVTAGPGGAKNLRNWLAHQSSIPELTQRAMTFHLLADGRILRFDHEIMGFPMIKTAHRIIPAVASLVGEMCEAVFALDAGGNERPGFGPCLNPPRDTFKLLWDNPTVHFDEFIDPTGNGPRVSIYKPILGGFRTHTQHLREDVLLAAKAFTVG